MILQWSSENQLYFTALRPHPCICYLSSCFILSPAAPLTLYLSCHNGAYPHTAHTRGGSYWAPAHICHSGRQASRSLGWWPGFGAGPGHLPARAAWKLPDLDWDSCKLAGKGLWVSRDMWSDHHWHSVQRQVSTSQEQCKHNDDTERMYGICNEFFIVILHWNTLCNVIYS